MFSERFGVEGAHQCAVRELREKARLLQQCSQDVVLRNVFGGVSAIPLRSILDIQFGCRDKTAFEVLC